jgi:hypothetical protein
MGKPKRGSDRIGIRKYTGIWCRCDPGLFRIVTKIDVGAIWGTLSRTIGTDGVQRRVGEAD